jgi:hypothetical protein
MGDKCNYVYHLKKFVIFINDIMIFYVPFAILVPPGSVVHLYLFCKGEPSSTLLLSRNHHWLTLS